MIWHSSGIEEVIKELETDKEQGLTGAEVAVRIKKYGENRSFAKNKRTFAKEFTKRLFKTTYIALIILAVVLIVTGAIAKHTLWISPITIILVLLMQAALGAGSALKNEKLVQKLKDKVSLSAKVIRDGKTVSVNASLLVPGDIVLLEQGDYIPADGRIIEENSLICDESAVTDDSAPVKKDAAGLCEDICPVKKRSNMVFSGCLVTYGKGSIVVTDTGKFSQIGKINEIKEQTIGTETASKKYLRELGAKVSIALGAFAAVIFILSIITVKTDVNQSFSDLVLSMLTLAVSLYAAGIHKALPRLVTSAISFAVSGMLNRNTVLKNPEKIEVLDSVSVIISDKTGTLTRNRMKMTSIFDGQNLIDLNADTPPENAVTIVRTGALCCNCSFSVGAGGKTKEFGDPTEIGIVSACNYLCNLSKDELENIYPRLAEVPFDSDRKLMTVVNMINNRPFAIVKGSPEALFPCCTGGNLKGAKEAAIKMGEKGERIIAVGIKPLSQVPSNPTSAELECNLTLLGLFGMSDSLSRTTKNSVKMCENAGIRVVMVTGDNIITATAIAKELGIIKEGQLVITGEQLGSMSDEELLNKVENISVYCGINDSDKERIVKAWQEKGEIVAVTGDSVDDAVSLKAADIGCAMGTNSTDIAKDSADIILSDNSFISIVNAIKTARNTFFNIRHGSQLYFAAIIGEVIALVFGFILFKKPVFSAPALLFINTLVLLVLSRALAGEPDRKNSMVIPPRGKKEGLFKSPGDFDFVWQGVIIGVLTLISFKTGGEVLSTGAAFSTFTLLLMFLTFSVRICSSIYHEGFKVGKNMLLSLGAVAASVVILLATPVSLLFGITEFLWTDILTSLSFGIILFAICEIVKFVRK